MSARLPPRLSSARTAREDAGIEVRALRHMLLALPTQSYFNGVAAAQILQ